MYETLRRFLPGARLSTHERLCEHTSFKIGGPAEIYAQPSRPEELINIIRFCRENGAPFTLLGGGTNVLVKDTGLPGVTVQLRHGLINCRIDGNIITADAGVSLKTLADTACKANLSGLAFAAGIPGTVGGGVFMNAGAYEHELKELFQSAEVLLPNGDIITMRASEMAFGYRYSALHKNGGVVLSAAFKLLPGHANEIQTEMNELHKRRLAKQPLEYPSAGSVFKRPPGQYAAKLISQCNLGGYTVGGAQVSEKHTGFIINRGGAAASDVLTLIEHIQKTVQDKFGIWLEMELRVLG